MDVYVSGKKLRLKPIQAIGKGGEADIYDIGNGKALKLFKQPNHPDYQNSLTEQQAAIARLDEHQFKLRLFPNNLPMRVIQPQDLVTDQSGKTIFGYTMSLLSSAEVLLKYSQRNFRQAGISNQTAVDIFKDLHTTVTNLHKVDVVIGDFNDLNILVRGTEAYLIDADSFQLSSFPCRVFTTRFVDPLLCDPQGSKPILIESFNTYSDWYAFTVMLMQCLLYVDPYGGVYKPKISSQRIPHEARPLHGITVFHPEVKYPKPAIPYQVLPDELLDHFHQVFEKDLRVEFRRSLLDHLQWTTCLNCGTEHARNICPNCIHTAPKSIPVLTKVSRTVTATKIFTTEGIILVASVQAGKLNWLYHYQGDFKRENDYVIFSGDLDPQLQLKLQGKATLVGKQGQVITLISGESPSRLAVDSCGNQAIFDTNEFARYWLYSGQLLRDGEFGAEYIGDVLAGQTQFWIGSHFGFGFYRAGDLSVAFVFDAKRKGLCDRVSLPRIQGQIIDATCSFTSQRCWFFLATQEQGKTVHRCIIIHANGTVEATVQAEQNDGSWLGTLHGKCAVSNFLLAATDEGIVRVEVHQEQIIKTKEFPDTEPFVNANSQLFVTNKGLYVVNQKEIQLLQIA